MAASDPTTAPKRSSIALLCGGIASVCLVGLTAGTWLGGVQVFLGWIGNLKYPILIGLAIVAALAEKKRNGGFLEFRAGLKTCFAIFVLALTVQTLFAWLLLNVIDPPFKEKLLVAVPIRMAEAYRHFGMSEDQVSQALDAEKGSDPFSLGRMFQGMGFSYILHFLIALLIAAVIRRKGPSPDPIT
jgi:peptidoglycan/LPS O-acetylase OafA/YrhL